LNNVPEPRPSVSEREDRPAGADRSPAPHASARCRRSCRGSLRCVAGGLPRPPRWLPCPRCLRRAALGSSKSDRSAPGFRHRIQADQHRCPHCDLGRVRSSARARRAQVVGIESQRSLALLRVYSTWFGLAAPKNVPVDIIDRLNKAVNDGLADSKLNAQLRDITGVPMPGSPADFGQFIAEETEEWAKVIKFSGVKSE